jgi:uncharacterized protein YceK|tara:strand:+ start:249 stop:470 length:222 start_codon:yes stop_codon:yes gene_type:complete
MHKSVLIFVMMMTLMFVGCETVRQVKAGCWGYWIHNEGHKRGTRLDNQNNNRPMRQCVDENFPHQDTEKRPYG